MPPLTSLAAFNRSLLTAHAAYYKLPGELRDSRSAHGAHLPVQARVGMAVAV